MARIVKFSFLLALLALPSFHTATAGTIRYNRDIRPILSDKCFFCHGPDKNKRKADLRLDVRDDAMKATKDHEAAFVPGRPDESELIKRILTDDADDVMPPPESKKTLTDAQKTMLTQWIAEGAVYEPHWAYTPLVKPAEPQVSGFKVPNANSIDAFILAALAEKKTTPSPEAHATTLIRRVSLDLTGLPPSPELLKRYLDAAEPFHLSHQSYEALVDELLGSPHFGERWAVWWLDAVRFADTVGFHGDQNQRIFPYRDYVIDAFNSNKHFDQFTLEQIAGDLLPHPTQEQIVATGFNRLNMMTREGGAQAKEYLAKYQADRVRTIGSTWLGSGMTCCECHDHKYDPLTQRDFYSLSAYFADVKQWGVYADYGYTPNPELKGWSNDHPFPPEVEVESPFLKQRLAKLNQQMGETAITAANTVPAGSFDQWCATLLSFLERNPDGWSTPVPAVTTRTTAPAPKRSKTVATVATKSGPKKKENLKAIAPAKASTPPKEATPADDSRANVRSDGRILITAKNMQTSVVTLKPGTIRVAAIKIELLPDPAHKNSIELNGTQNGMTLTPRIAMLKSGDAKPSELKLLHADADAKEPRFSGTAELPDVKGGWKTSIVKAGTAQTSVWLLDQAAVLAADDALTVTLPNHTAGCFRVSLSAATPLRPFEGNWPASLAQAVKDAAKTDATATQMYLLQSSDNQPARDAWKSLFAEALACNHGKAWTQVTAAVKEPLTIRLLPRGNWQDESGPIMQPATLGIIPAIPGVEGRRQNRIHLAKWLCSKENPLTPRAFTNRVWKQFFGNGLSNSIDDLGAQGEPPSHPELLDWLAADFRDGGWDFKRLVKTIVMSATYRQDSKARPDLKDIDPQNRLLAFQNPRRLDAEFVRDNALSVAGILNLDIGGPSVKPYQPANYYENLQFPNRDYVAETDSRQWRRGLYMHWQRTFLHPMLANFDAPARDETACTRNVSNTPQQALTLLNDPTFVETAKMLADRVLSAQTTGSDESRIEGVFRRTLARAPREREKQSLMAFLATQRETFKNHPEDARKLLATGLKPAPHGEAVELASWTSLCRVVLNLHETITRY